MMESALQIPLSKKKNLLPLRAKPPSKALLEERKNQAQILRAKEDRIIMLLDKQHEILQEILYTSTIAKNEKKKFLKDKIDVLERQRKDWLRQKQHEEFMMKMVDQSSFFFFSHLIFLEIREVMQFGFGYNPYYPEYLFQISKFPLFLFSPLPYLVFRPPKQKKKFNTEPNEEGDISQDNEKEIEAIDNNIPYKRKGKKKPSLNENLDEIESKHSAEDQDDQEEKQPTDEPQADDNGEP